MTTNDLSRLSERRARNAARAAERAAFAELRAYGLRARHAAKLAYLAARTQQERPEDPEQNQKVA